MKFNLKIKHGLHRFSYDKITISYEIYLKRKINYCDIFDNIFEDYYNRKIRINNTKLIYEIQYKRKSI